MSEAASSCRKICPHCGAITRFRATECWICGAAVEPNWETVLRGTTPMDLPARRPLPPALSARRGDSPARFQFGLSTLLLVMTLVAILCSISVMNLGLGVFLAILILGGFIGLLRQSVKAEAPLTGEEKFWAFFGSVGITVAVLAVIVVIIVVVIVAAFFIMCFAPSGGNRWG